MNDIRMKNPSLSGEFAGHDCAASKHAVCWSSILAGAVGTIAVSFALFVLASSYGLAIASPWSGEGVSATAVGANVVIAIIVIQWLSSAFGGFLTGRLRACWHVHSDEICFRDTAHGFLTWALATLVMVMMLSSAVTGVAKSGAAGAGFAAASSEGTANASDDRTAYFVDSLFRTNRPASDVSQAETNLEATRIILKGFSDDGMSAADKAYLSSVVASRTGITTAEAETRIDNTLSDMKKAADTARKTGATLAIFTFLSLVIGAFIASVAAVLGGRCRDDQKNY